jgi:hypothetical protein
MEFFIIIGVPPGWFVCLSPVYSWFADMVGLCMALTLHLWEYRNFVWLFEHMLLLVECIGYVKFVREECNVSKGEVDIFSIIGLCRPYIPCNFQDDFHHRGHIGHLSFWWHWFAKWSPVHLTHLGLSFFFFLIPFYLQAVHVHSANGGTLRKA